MVMEILNLEYSNTIFPKLFLGAIKKTLWTKYMKVLLSILTHGRRDRTQENCWSFPKYLDSVLNIVGTKAFDLFQEICRKSIKLLKSIFSHVATPMTILQLIMGRGKIGRRWRIILGSYLLVNDINFHE